jgi:hypothetical protein
MRSIVVTMIIKDGSLSKMWTKLFFLTKKHRTHSSSSVGFGFGWKTANCGGAPGTGPPPLLPTPKPGPFGVCIERARTADGPRRGGAIMAANGSVDGFGAVSGADFTGVVAIGGGPTGFAFSAGSSPGKTQTLFFSSK